MFCVAETDICILKYGLDWSNLSRNLVKYQCGFYQCSSNHNETFKGTETCGHAMIRKGGPLKTDILLNLPQNSNLICHNAHPFQPQMPILISLHFHTLCVCSMMCLTVLVLPHLTHKC